MTQKDIQIVGNMNGKVIECSNCGEPWENTYLVTEGYDLHYEQFIMESQIDDPGGEETRIVGLNACECCGGWERGT